MLHCIFYEPKFVGIESCGSKLYFFTEMSFYRKIVCKNCKISSPTSALHQHLMSLALGWNFGAERAYNNAEG